MNKKETLKYLKENEFDIQSARCGFLLSSFYFKVYVNSRLFKKNLSPSFGYFKTFDEKSPFYQITSKKTLHDFAKEAYLEFLEDPQKLISKIEKRGQLHEKIEALWKGYGAIKKKNNFSQTISFFLRFLDSTKKWIEYASIGEDKWQIIEEEFVPEFSKKNNLKISECKNILAIISHPETPSAFKLERQKVLEICLYLIENPKIRQAVQNKNYALALSDKELMVKANEYINKFFWIKTDFYSTEHLTPESLLADLGKELKKGEEKIHEERRELNENIAEVIKKKEQIISKFKLTNKEKRVFRLLELCVVWHDTRKEEMMKQFHYIFSIFEDISKMMGMSYKGFSALSSEEFEAFLQTGQIASKKPEKMFVVFEKGKKINFFSGELADKMLSAVYKVDFKKELSGMVASHGNKDKLTGRIKIVFDPRHASFKKGEILVTSMTRVEFMPLMSKAKAIITNEGGIACHAAIVSRELNLPCIIGTKTATKVLKSGNWVEMDLDKGRVKIIKQ